MDHVFDVARRDHARPAQKAKALKRKDLAGKTGTTNDQRDAWFSGYNGGLVATAWVGFDQVRPLGRRETGGSRVADVDRFRARRSTAWKNNHCPSRVHSSVCG